MNHTTLKTWLTRGELEKLEHVVLEGRGARLLGEYSPDVKTRAFLRSLPNYLTKISQVHDAVVRGSLEDLQKFLTDEPKKKYAFAKDPSGTPLLIKAVYFGKQNIIEWLIANYPNTVEGKTALHYCGNCKDPEAIWDLLVEAGCDTSICDKRGRPASYYLQNPQEIELTEPDKMDDHKFSKNEVLDVKPSNIRIWIHNRDIKKLQQVLWEGHGSKLQCEISNNPRVKRFLEAVPYIMVTIKQIHQAVINNDLNTLQDKTAEPVSPVILCAKDSNGLNPLHKAAGLGYIDIATEIVEKYSQAVLAVDNEGKTPLHYAAALRDSGSMYDLLVEYGADESKLDHKQKAAGFYRNRPGDIDLSNLVVIPDAPRTSGTEYPKNWDWRILESQGSLRSKKRSSSDSAIGSAESATKSEENSEMIEEGEKADEPPTEDAPEEAEAEPEEEEEAEPEPEPEAEAEAEAEEEEEEEEPEAEPEPEPEEGEAEEQPEAEENEEEKNEPSTGDSGVEEIPADEDQVIVGEHEELPEVELNDAGMPEDPEVEDLLVNGNMEQLASLVLNGEGSRLLGRQSGNPDLQAFIDNVPSYIGKIHAVHIAAKEGNLRDLQNALDRRKFAIARDNASPHVDVDGRTPLHYAATLADNGHYYNLLLHLGANPLTRDNFEQKAEYYRTNQEDLSHKRLLRDFGAREELADEMLSDKVAGGDVYSSRRDINEADTLTMLERCFRLLVNNRRNSIPNTPAANAGTMLGRCMKRPIFDKIKHRVTRMDHNLFDVIWPSLQKYQTLNNSNYNHYSQSSQASSALSSRSMADIDSDLDMIVVAPDFESYYVFAELLDPLIRNLHCVTATGELPDQPEPSFFSESSEVDENANISENISSITGFDIDPSRKYISAGTVDACRNLEAFSLPLMLTINQLEETEKQITGVLISAEVSLVMAEGSSEDEGGTYYTLNEVLERPSDIRMRLAAAGLLVPINETEASDEKRMHGRHWPYGRGVYVASAGDLAVWVNVRDHIRIIACTSENKPGQIGKAYVRIAKVLTILDKKLRFKKDKKFGFLSARPSAVGNTLKFSVIIKLQGLSRKMEHLKGLCIVRGLKAMETMRSDTFRISNQQSLTITELQTLQDFINAVVSIISLEKEMIFNNSMNIASLIVNMFRKKSSARKFRNSSDDFPIFREEDGRYLASSLGTPLIKGLTEVVHRRPKNPKSDVLIISSEETTEEYDLDSGNLDDGYPKSPESSILPESAFMETSRDEHGQSLIHYSAVRTHPKNGFFHLLQERQINIALRDELYRTARDVAEEANFYDNIEEIDRFVVYLSARGETDKLVELLLEGYDHILDTEDDGGDLESTQKIFQKNGGGSTLFAIGKNTLGRCSLHIAVLGEHVDIVRYIAENYPETLRIGDNMERTALHYAMGVPSVEILTSILIKCGAKRIQKDIYPTKEQDSRMLE
ncbi:hypothetical protein G9C98_001275 [Cotesia typhae]|uniref:Arginine kinase n=1 Tax=Cotesia typhae TaxID=2053667 RepID=A0A8J5QY06_9HYME|nr:hypothetical protein G9C98_001275 [Cotesia typhae]